VRAKLSVITSFFLAVSFSQISAGEDILGTLEREITEIIKKAKPSVVSVSSKLSKSYFLPEEKSFFLFREKKRRTVCFRNIGTGIIFSKEGYIITKGSVIQGLEDIKVTLYDGREFPAKPIGIDEESDIAVIKIEGEDLIPAELGDSDELKAGSWITIIGNSMGLSPSVSIGLINGIRENGLIQLSANITPGNSGSPVFNTRGEVVGIITGRINLGFGDGVPFSWSTSWESGLAYPINKIKEVVAKLIKGEGVGGGWLGVTLDNLPKNGEKRVPRISRVIKGSPAEKAGLREGDLIVQYGGERIEDFRELMRLVKETPPYQVVEIRLKRGDKIISKQVRIGQKPLKGCYTTEGTWRITQEEYPFRYWRYEPPSPERTERYFLQQRIRRLEREIQIMKRLLKER